MKVLLLAMLSLLVANMHAQLSLESNLPVFIINTENQHIVDEPKINVRLSIHEPSTTDTTEITFDGHAGIEIRGRSSQYFEKKSYGLETRASDGENLNVSILGLPEENDWVLHGPYADKSLIRNAFTYQVARSLGRYSPRSRLIELIINDEYQGVYMLTEKTKRDAKRVNVKNINTSSLDITGGYLLEINFELDTLQSGWSSRNSIRQDFDLFTDYQFIHPKANDITGNQASYIENWMHDLEDILISPDFADPLTGYPSKIDIDSWIDYILINELSRDVDAYFGSTFLVKKSDEKGGKIHAGPVWDHNFSYGNSDYCGGQSVEGFAIVYENVCEYRPIPIIFANVWKDPNFRKKTAERWCNLRKKELGPDLFTKLDSLSTLLKIPADRNFERWPVLDTYLWPNAYIGKTYQDELQYLGTWISGRLNWLDQQFSEELASQRIQSKGATISPNPASEFSTPHIVFHEPLSDEIEIQVDNIHGGVTNIFKASRLERLVRIPFELTKGIYIVSFQIDSSLDRQYLRLVIQ